MRLRNTLLAGTVLGMAFSPLAALGANAQEVAGASNGTAAEVQEEPAWEENLIVVTGSYLKGRVEDGALPVDVFGADELDKRGLDNPLDFIKTLPSVGPVLGDSNSFGAGPDQGVGSINLRSLGRERTLVLFNGRRFIPDPGEGAIDTNLIPFFAIDRVEVLKDGAASTYGSDAIAGVANFATKTGFTGLELQADYSLIDGSDDNYQMSALYGFNVGTANFIIGAGWQHRSELPTTERDFTQVPYEVNPTGYSFLSNPGTYLPMIGTTPVGLGVDGGLLDACGALGGLNGSFPTGPSSALPVCRYSYIPFANLVEDEDRYQVYGQADIDLDDKTLFHVEVLWSKSDQLQGATSPSYPPVQGPNGPGSVSAFYVPAYNPGYADFLAQTFDPAAPGGAFPYASNGASILLGRPFALGGNLLDDRGAGLARAESNAWRISAGLEHDFTESFSGQLYTTYLRNTRIVAVHDFVGQRLQNALLGFGGPDCTGTTPGANGCQFFNPFINSAPGNPALGLNNPAYVPGNENDPDLVDYLYEESGTYNREEQFIVDLVFNGDFNVFGSSVDYAFGGQYRSSDYLLRPVNDLSNPVLNPCPTEGATDCAFPTGPFIFLGQYAPTEVSQRVYALFAEARVEPLEGFEITGAVRYEDYGNPVGSTINPKLSIRWQVADFLTLRGSIGDTFRGPLPSSLQTDGSTLVNGIDAAGGAFKAVQFQGNPDLDPETALTYNIGALVDVGGFTASVDYWTYEFSGRFTDLPVQAIASAAAPGPVSDGTQLVDCSSPFADFIVFTGGACVQGTTIANDISRINVQTVNGPDVTTSGIDFALGYKAMLGAVSLNMGANATYVTRYKFSDFSYEGLLFSEGYEASGYANYNREPGTISPWRASGFASFGYDVFNLTYNVTYVDGVTDNRCPAKPAPCTSTPEFGPTDFGRKIDSYMQHDLFVTYDLDLGGTDVRLSGGIQNIFDADPPAARLELSYDPFIANPLGRVFKFGTRVRF